MMSGETEGVGQENKVNDITIYLLVEFATMIVYGQVTVALARHWQGV